MEEENAQLATMDRSPSEGTTSPEASTPDVETSQESSDMPPPSRRNTQHTRAASSTSRRPNRLSLVFPVAPSSNGTESTKQTPTSASVPSLPPTPAETARPDDPGGFLVALAAQERKVLELREELNKAEADLLKLKKQWAMHEASKKTSQLRNGEQIQALQNLAVEGRKSIEEQVNLKRSIELERRKSLLGVSAVPKDSRRKVITGGHTRTLSLLTSDKLSQSKPSTPTQESNMNGQPNGLSRSTTMPDTSQGITHISTRLASRHSYQNSTTGVKQIADDVKAGLWTFLEDLRQATVGDEAITGVKKQASHDTSHQGINRKTSRGSLSNNSGSRGKTQTYSGRDRQQTRTWDTLTGDNAALFDVAGTLWEDQTKHSTKELKATKKKTKSLSLAPAVVSDFDDDWSNWDSPPPKSPTRWSGSTVVSDTAASPSKGGSDGEDTK